MDQGLENEGETNVYIRPSRPETTNETLRSWGDRFGSITSTKAIIDSKTRLCKGIGFIKYENSADAKNYIFSVRSLDYEASFAKRSFHERFNDFADESNTNLYVSNIPETMDKSRFSAYFQPFNVCSAKILRDKNDNSCGAGFVRQVSSLLLRSTIDNLLTSI